MPTKDAIQRIKMANLFQLLTDRELFEENEGDLEIIEMVEGEIRQFALYRLEQLIGMRDNTGVIQIQNTSNPFTGDEIKALKLLAQSALSMTGNVHQSPTRASQVPATVPTPVFASNPPMPTLEAKPVRRRRSKNKTVDATVPSQPVDPNNIEDVLKNTKYQNKPITQPIPMPTQMQMDMINAELAESNAKGFESQGFAGHVQTLIK